VFNKIIHFVLEEEGGYVNHPSDPGGETKYGISKRSYPNVDIKNLTKEQAIEIYRKDYWRDEWETLGFPLAACMTDTAVNMGMGRAKKFLEQCNDDYVTYLQLRIARYKDIIAARPASKVFEKGWMNRVARLRRFIDAEKEGTT
jgi:lysozyme family protein